MRRHLETEIRKLEERGIFGMANRELAQTYFLQLTAANDFATFGSA